VKFDAPEIAENYKREYIAINDTNASPTTNNWKPKEEKIVEIMHKVAD
jgi:hypothetical protein